jgi:hypothetical protein
MAVLTPFVLAGVGLGLGLYFGVRTLLLERWGIHSPIVTGALTVGPCAVAFIGLGALVLKVVSPRLQRSLRSRAGLAD